MGWLLSSDGQTVRCTLCRRLVECHPGEAGGGEGREGRALALRLFGFAGSCFVKLPALLICLLLPPFLLHAALVTLGSVLPNNLPRAVCGAAS